MTRIKSPARPPLAAGRRRSALASVLLVACILPGVSGSAHGQPASEQPQDLPTVRLNAGMHNIRAQVARTAEQRRVGLMHRPTLGTNDGMLFIFEHPAQQCFWMKNTLLPLSIAFVADDGRIVNLDEMQPQTLNQHCSTQPVRYVLEMNRGWFKKRGLKAGDRLEGGPFETGSSTRAQTPAPR